MYARHTQCLQTDVTSAKEYVHFVVDTVVSRRLFACLQIEPKTYWEQVYNAIYYTTYATVYMMM
jgi:Domain of unknown function (DUF1744)